jgi:hypothetical protein
MNALDQGLKNLACGAVALAITAAMSWSFVESTAVVHGSNNRPATARVAKLSTQPQHAWFGQPEPAVLVD